MTKIYKTDLPLLIQHNPNEGQELKINSAKAKLAGHFSLIHIESSKMENNCEMC